MRHFIRPLLYLAALTFSLCAVAWDEPVKPERSQFPDGSWATPSVGNKYYIYNVGASQFLGTGLDWGTRTVTTVDSVVFVSQAKVAVALNRNYVVPFSIENSDIEGTLYIRTLNTNKGEQAYVTAEGNASWSDGDTGRAGHWEITAVENGEYQLTVADAGVCLGVDGIGLTTSYTWADAITGAQYSTNWKFIEASDENAQLVRDYCRGHYQVYLYEMEVYDVRKSLYDYLLESQELGIDNTAAATVYESETATLEELKAALDALKTEVDSKAFWKGIAESSEDNPFDVTKYVMQNPDFSASCENGKTPPGWEITATGTNIGQMNRKDTNPADETLYLSNFVECWTPAPATIGDGYIGQWVTGLPQGRYRLTMEAAACNQSDGFDPSTITGVYLFAGNGQFNMHSEESVAGAAYDIRHYEWDFDFNAERLLLGLLFEKTNANWISADNFHLLAIGSMQEDPNRVALMDAVEAAELVNEQLGENRIDDEYAMNVEKAAAEAFTTALDAAYNALNNSDADHYADALAQLQQAQEAVLKSADVYEQFQQLYEDALMMAQQLKDQGQWEPLQTALLEWAGGELTDAFEAGALTADDLPAAREKADGIVNEFVAVEGNVQPGDNLTVLIKNADFSRGQYGRTDAGTFDGDENSIPGWNISSGNVTELSGDYHNIEVYGKAFDFNQTIKNLPAGTYQLTVQGYVRVDRGENDMALYAGVSSKKFMEITDEYSETALLTDQEDGTSTGSWPYDSPRGDGQGYQPNSMQGAMIYFSNINPATGKPFYLNDVTIGHTGGDLTIGVRSDAKDNALWILWDNFTLTYLSAEAIQPILDEIDELRAQVEELLGTHNTTMFTREMIDYVFSRVDEKESITTEEAAMELLNAVKHLIQDIQDDHVAYLEVMEIYDNYLNKAAEISNDEYQALLDEVGSKISMMEFQTINDIYDACEKMENEWVPAVMKDVQDGDNVTLLLNNPDFETLNDKFWTIVPELDGGRIGDNQGYQANAIYNNEAAGIHVEHFIEAWRADSQPLFNGLICQEIAGTLPEGYYRLEADGFATNQAGEPDGGIQGIYLFAQNGEKERLSAFQPEADWIPQTTSVSFHADGQSTTTVGICVKETNSNWFLADNFRLTWLGKTAPDAVRDLTARSAAANTVFTLDGRQVGTRQLAKGLYIINGKKVIIR
ncbi:MAG: hypothetical protein J5545_03390 [Bacteroidaceae bacterium]|nr:hypothetical protein [Bacteroidaceae bacterium]